MDELKSINIDGIKINHGEISDQLLDQLLAEGGWAISRDKRSTTEEGFKLIDPQVTTVCDHACEHCWADLQGQHMSVETFGKILDFCDANNIKALQFTGGEPTLNPNLFLMARMAKERGFFTILRTHGRHLSRPVRGGGGELLNADLCAQYFDSITLSLDGMAETNFAMRPAIKLVKGAKDEKAAAEQQFEETLAGWKALYKAAQGRKDIMLSINTVVTAKNYQQIGELAAFLEQSVAQGDFRVDKWNLSQVMPSYPAESKLPVVDDRLAVTSRQFKLALLGASKHAPGISKIARTCTPPRALIANPEGEVCIGTHPETLGVIGRDDAVEIASRAKECLLKGGLLEGKASYLVHNPTPQYTRH